MSDQKKDDTTDAQDEQDSSEADAQDEDSSKAGAQDEESAEADAQDEDSSEADAQDEESAEADEQDEESAEADEQDDAEFFRRVAEEADFSLDEDIDPELLALADEQPTFKWHRPVIMVVVCVLIVVMMVWFWMDLTYFFSPTDPINLGDAHDAELTVDMENRYVHFDGIPLVPRNTNPGQCGPSQGFPNYQRRAICRGQQLAIPLMGRPEHDLIVQRYVVRQLRVSFTVPADNREEAIEKAVEELWRMSAVQDVRLARPDEIGKIIVRIEAQGARTSIAAIRRSIRFKLESSVNHISNITVEGTEEGPPGTFEGRVVRIDNLGSRFAAVARYLNDCTNYPVEGSTFVVLDGSEAGDGVMSGLCYGQAPRQYWPFVVLYVVLVSLLVLNIVLLVRFFRARPKK